MMCCKIPKCTCTNAIISRAGKPLEEVFGTTVPSTEVTVHHQMRARI